jgi:hypothetical protein
MIEAFGRPLGVGLAEPLNGSAIAFRQVHRHQPGERLTKACFQLVALGPDAQEAFLIDPCHPTLRVPIKVACLVKLIEQPFALLLPPLASAEYGAADEGDLFLPALRARIPLRLFDEVRHPKFADEVLGVLPHPRIVLPPSGHRVVEVAEPPGWVGGIAGAADRPARIARLAVFDDLGLVQLPPHLHRDRRCGGGVDADTVLVRVSEVDTKRVCWAVVRERAQELALAGEQGGPRPPLPNQLSSGPSVEAVGPVED